MFLGGKCTAKPASSDPGQASILGTNRGYAQDQADRATMLRMRSQFEAGAKSKLHRLGDTTIQQVIGKIIRVLLGVVGSVALGMFLFGGIMILTAAGNPERVQKGTKVLVWSALGVIVILTSYALIDFIFVVVV